jgi:MFS family permease
MLKIEIAIAFISALLLLIFDQSSTMLWVGTCLYGLGMSATFPTMMALSNEFLYMQGTAVSIVFICASVGAFLFPFILGVVTTESAPYMFVVVILCLKSIEIPLGSAILNLGKKTPKSLEKQSKTEGEYQRA